MVSRACCAAMFAFKWRCEYTCACARRDTPPDNDTTRSFVSLPVPLACIHRYGFQPRGRGCGRHRHPPLRDLHATTSGALMRHSTAVVGYGASPCHLSAAVQHAPSLCRILSPKPLSATVVAPSLPLRKSPRCIPVVESFCFEFGVISEDSHFQRNSSAQLVRRGAVEMAAVIAFG